MNDAVGAKRVSLFCMWPVIGQTIIELKKKNRSMLGDIVPIVILFICLNSLPHHIKRGINAECLERIANIDCAGEPRLGRRSVVA